MKSKNVAYFLVIGSLLCIMLDLNSLLYNVTQSKLEFMSFLQSALHFLLGSSAAVGFAWVGFSLLSKKRLPEKKMGIVFAVLSGLFVALRVYYNITYFSAGVFRENTLSLIFNYLTILFPLSTFVFWLMFWRDKIGKGTVWLLIGALFLCFSSFLNKIVLFIVLFSAPNLFGDSWGYYTWIAGFFDLVFPLSLVVFAFFILKGQERKRPVDLPQNSLDQDELLDGIAEKTAPSAETIGKQEKIPSVLDWLSDFLLVLIPLFALGFLIWRGQNNQDRYRRNWAIATLFWTALGWSLLAFLYVPLLQGFGRSGGVAAILVLAVLTLFSVAVGLSGKARRDDEDGDEDAYIPSTLDWFGRIFVISIPLLGLILLIVWAIDEENTERKKWAIANLIRMAIMLVYYFAIYVTYAKLVSYTSSFVNFNF